MPYAPKKPCSLCGRLSDKARCEQHRQQAERTRGSAAKRGYGRRWQVYSRFYLREHPLCIDPDKRHQGIITPATCTDHVIPHKGDMVLFWDTANHQPLCSSCHSYKTAREDGGFGNSASL